MANMASHIRLALPWPQLEVQDAAPWQPVKLSSVPAGKTKTIVVDLAGQLPASAGDCLSTASSCTGSHRVVETTHNRETRITTLAPRALISMARLQRFAELRGTAAHTGLRTRTDNAKWRMTPSVGARYGRWRVARRQGQRLGARAGAMIDVAFRRRPLPSKPPEPCATSSFLRRLDKDADFHVARTTVSRCVARHGRPTLRPQAVLLRQRRLDTECNTRWVVIHTARSSVAAKRCASSCAGPRARESSGAPVTAAWVQVDYPPRFTIPMRLREIVEATPPFLDFHSLVWFARPDRICFACELRRHPSRFLALRHHGAGDHGARFWRDFAVPSTSGSARLGGAHALRSYYTRAWRTLQRLSVWAGCSSRGRGHLRDPISAARDRVHCATHRGPGHPSAVENWTGLAASDLRLPCFALATLPPFLIRLAPRSCPPGRISGLVIAPARWAASRRVRLGYILIDHLRCRTFPATGALTILLADVLSWTARNVQ